MSTNNGYQNIVDVEPEQEQVPQVYSDPDTEMRQKIALQQEKRAKHRAGRKWTNAERLNIRLQITDMLLRGSTIGSIIDYMVDEDAADQDYISAATVKDIIKSIEQEWRDTYLSSINKVKERELAKLDKIEEEAWDAWEASKQGKTRDQVNSEISVDRKSGAAKRTPRVTRTTKETASGDPRYMDIIFKCMTMRIRLYGIDEIRNTGTPDMGDVGNELQRRLDKYKDALGGTSVTLERVTITEHHPAESVDPERSASEAGRILDTTGSVR